MNKKIVVGILLFVILIIIFFATMTYFYVKQFTNIEKLDNFSKEIYSEYHTCLIEEKNSINLEEICSQRIKIFDEEYKKIIIQTRGISEEQYNIEKTWAREARPDFKLELGLSCVNQYKEFPVNEIFELCLPSKIGR